MNYRSLLWLAAAGILFHSPGAAAELDAPPSCDIGYQATVPEIGLGRPKELPAGLAILEASGMRPPDMDWVNATLAGMSLDEKIGQMMMPWYSASGSLAQVDAYKISGCVFSSWNTTGAASVVAAVNSLQSAAAIPLWFAADSECGAGARFGDATLFPMNMAVGAADDEVLSASEGWVTAREAWAMGIQIGFGPVVDVQTNPLNPIIATRSYGDRPDLVARMAQSYVSGAHPTGMLACLKHYPGHGPTDEDSHLALPVVNIPEPEIRSVHIYPYQQLISAGFCDLVMSAHVWFTALDPGADPWPATLSYRAMTEILRADLGFSGVAISDAFSMAGVSGIMSPEEAVVTAVQNGLDVILIPPNLSTCISALRTAVLGGAIPESRIDDSVRRILAAKSRMWLPEMRFRDPAAMWTVLKHPDHLAVAETLARKSVTRFWEAPAVLPLEPAQNVLCLRLVPDTIIFNSPARSSSHFTDRLDAALPSFTLQHVNRNLSPSEIAAIVGSAGGFDRIVVAGYDWKPIMTDDQCSLVNQLIAGPTPVVFISFGSPYHALKLPDLQTFYCAYCNAECSQRAGADALLGVLEPEGGRPVSVYDSTPCSFWSLY